MACFVLEVNVKYFHDVNFRLRKIEIEIVLCKIFLWKLRRNNSLLFYCISNEMHYLSTDSECFVTLHSCAAHPGVTYTNEYINSIIVPSGKTNFLPP